MKNIFLKLAILLIATFLVSGCGELTEYEETVLLKETTLNGYYVSVHSDNTLRIIYVYGHKLKEKIDFEMVESFECERVKTYETASTIEPTQCLLTSKNGVQLVLVFDTSKLIGKHLINAIQNKIRKENFKIITENKSNK